MSLLFYNSQYTSNHLLIGATLCYLSIELVRLSIMAPSFVTGELMSEVIDGAMVPAPISVCVGARNIEILSYLVFEATAGTVGSYIR